MATVFVIRRTLSLLLASVVAVPLMACSTIEGMNPFATAKYKTTIDPIVPPDDIYNQGLARLNKNDDSGATKEFSKLDSQYPFSKYAEKGALMTAYSQYRDGKYDDAVGSANLYYNKYPNSPDAPYALYLAAMSYYNQIPDISRDQEVTRKARELFQQIVQKFPQSPYATEAKFKIQVTSDQLAGKEMSVGRYYLVRREYPAAINRFRAVLSDYQRTRETEEALERLTEAYLALGLPNEAETAAAVLGHNYPDSVWYKDAYARLKGGGFSPQEDQGSWISKTAHAIGLS
ncbi:MAG: outer membrane protein assembly factor BamD [Hyphomicrobiales bacterium]|nr:outer membrane protein assembly factor BamD [Hyphomicrobiales bacterium]